MYRCGEVSGAGSGEHGRLWMVSFLTWINCVPAPPPLLICSFTHLLLMYSCLMVEVPTCMAHVYECGDCGLSRRRRDLMTIVAVVSQRCGSSFSVQFSLSMDCWCYIEDGMVEWHAGRSSTFRLKMGQRRFTGKRGLLIQQNGRSGTRITIHRNKLGNSNWQLLFLN